uniref:Small glutamine rich tetratricopeptide repeat co-chaperone beta n=1 Tax=Ornithorhynchus anatinus TaxID=9258 RepID=A0A6I8NA55_ORNAN
SPVRGFRSTVPLPPGVDGLLAERFPELGTLPFGRSERQDPGPPRCRPGPRQKSGKAAGRRRFGDPGDGRWAFLRVPPRPNSSGPTGSVLTRRTGGAGVGSLAPADGPPEGKAGDVAAWGRPGPGGVGGGVPAAAAPLERRGGRRCRRPRDGESRGGKLPRARGRAESLRETRRVRGGTITPVQKGNRPPGHRPPPGFAPPPPPSSPRDAAPPSPLAGNNHMKEENYGAAVDCYTQAIELDPRNAVYYCNRAAAQSKLSHYTEAIEDCERAIAIDSKYSKAYGRMGLALTAMNKYEEAIASYRKALDLDPENDSYKSNLKVAEQKLREVASPTGTGLSFDMASLINNPAFISMAASLVQNPQVQQLMSGMMTNAIGGPAAGVGGLTDLSSLIQAGQQFAQQIQQQNPELIEQLRNHVRSRSFSGSAAEHS